MEIHIPKHRAPVTAKTSSHPHYFRPRHCAGGSCLHDHAGRSMPLRGTMRLVQALVLRAAA